MSPRLIIQRAYATLARSSVIVNALIINRPPGKLISPLPLTPADILTFSPFGHGWLLEGGPQELPLPRPVFRRKGGLSSKGDELEAAEELL